MLVYAGIDEAGYGPMFGPLVVARSVLICDRVGCDDDWPPLWRVLKAVVCRKVADKKKRIAVNDSKALYTPAAGLAHLERGVLAFAHAAGLEPANVDRLLHGVGYDPASRQPDQLWYAAEDGGPALPVAIDHGRLAISRAQLRRALGRSAIRVAPPSAAVIFEDRFNHMVHATRSKARCSWTFVAGHLQAIWEQFGTHQPRVVIDRQGGRTRYLELLGLLFDGADIRVLSETPLLSEYHIARADRSMRVVCQIDSEQHHMPVALASMTAKYLREVLMMRFNAFWQTHKADLKPTAGYYGDGKRFLDDIQPLIDQLAIDRQSLVRTR